MRTGRPKQSLELTVQERRDLTAVASSRACRMALVRRAQMILWTEDGMPVTEAARRLRLTRRWAIGAAAFATCACRDCAISSNLDDRAA